VHVAEAGAGDPLLLLHGWPEHWWAWRHVIPELAPSFRVLCADMPDAWSEADAELFLDSVREPPRARASSALYRTFLLALPGFLGGRYKSRRLRTPTLYLQGERDPVLRPAFVRGFEPYADDMALEFVPDCGHLMPEERPEVVVERALAFLPAG
jgi:pimeloyl-ACP methyl ester carboxylesterase